MCGLLKAQTSLQEDLATSLPLSSHSVVEFKLTVREVGRY